MVPVWPTAAPLEVRRYATQLFEHSHDTGSRPSTATYIAQMKTTCTNWRHAFTGASTFAKDRNVDAFMRVFQENLEAASAAAPAPPRAVATPAEIEAFWATDMTMKTHIEVPHGATEIPEGALKGCTLVTSIVLPA